jgi:hypothetical protein
MANITYQLYDPKTNSFAEFDDGTDVKTATSSTKEQIEAYAKQNGFKVRYIESASDYPTPELGPMADVGMTPMPSQFGPMADIGITRPEDVVAAPVDSVLMTDLEKEAAQVTPLGAIGGGLLEGVTLDIFKPKGKAAEERAFPTLRAGAEMAGALIPNIAADIAIAGATRGRLGATGTAAAGGALTGAIQGAAGSEEPTTGGKIIDALIGAGGGALGGAVGSKVAGPLMKKGGEYLKRLLPEIGTPKFPTAPTEKAAEETLKKVGKSAEEEMLKKKVTQSQLEKRKAIGEALKKRIASARKVSDLVGEKAAQEETALRNLIQEAEAGNLLTPEQGTRFINLQIKGKLTPDEAAEFKSLKKLMNEKADEAIKAKEKLPDIQRQQELTESVSGRPIPAESPLYWSPVTGKQYTQAEIKNIMKSKLEDLDADALYARITNLQSKEFRNFIQTKKLEEAIKNIDASIESKRKMYNSIRDGLIKVGGLEDYLKRFKGSMVGGAAGAEVGQETAAYGTRPSGVRRGSL